MATLILGTVGRALGGPIGGIVGTFLGGSVERAIFGGGKTREGPRLTDLAVQSSAYGEALPRIYGRMRVAGNVIWSPGIREAQQRSGGGKGGAAANSYSYSASFAVALSARRIAGVGRIWADGKLLRDAAGGYLFPATVRFHLGDDAQAPDPLIAAAEGAGRAPAYRGLAYAVFDDLPLADYANRIPNLTFEVIADAGDGIGVDVIVADVGAGATVIEGEFPALHGFVATRPGSMRPQLEPLVALADLGFVDDGTHLAAHAGSAAARVVIADADLGAAVPGKGEPARREHRAAASTVPDAVAIGFSDPARDYQFGLQRAARRTPATRADQHDLPAALDSVAAKALAEAMLARSAARRITAELHLPWRYAGVDAGAVVTAGGRAWRVRSRTLVAMLVELAVEAMPAAAAAGVRATDSGRVLDGATLPSGTTVLEVLDLPPLPGPLPMSPRLWLAAAGTGAGWRRADVLVSSDGGESYAGAASIGAPAVMGRAVTILPASAGERWDRGNGVEVALLNEAMWLESRSELAVLAGGNLALLGDEIIQFADATALAPGRFRLHGLLRGRRGTGGAVSGHRIGERFVLLDPDRLTALDPGTEAIGSRLRFKAIGAGENAATAAPVEIMLAGRALQPLSPVHLVASKTGAGLRFAWKRCSRAGFVWPDAADVPLAEEFERYRLELRLDGRRVRIAEMTEPQWIYPQAQFESDGGPAATTVAISVAQVGAVTGAGQPALAQFAIA